MLTGMGKKDQYPEMRLAVPTNFVRPSRTSRVLTPGIVLVTVAILAASSITGITIAASIFSSLSPHRPGLCAAQAFVLNASSISIVYLVLHFLAALNNEQVGEVRPPELRLHASCFILARLALVSWLVAMIASSVAASKPSACLHGTSDCTLQLLDVVCSSLAFLSTGAILTALESCNYPFQTPEIFHIRRSITCRVSSFGDDILDRSVSQSSLNGGGSILEEKEKLNPTKQESSVKRKPVPPKQVVAAECPLECTRTSVLSTAETSKSRDWGEEWTHLVQDTGNTEYTGYTGYMGSNSTASFSESSSGYTSISEQTSENSISKRLPRNRNVTPSSSISNLSMRSPLSTMRSAEHPDIPIPVQLRFIPLMVPPEWNVTKTTPPMAKLLPVADVHSLQRRPSAMPAPLRIPKRLPPLPRNASKARREAADVRIPDAYSNYRPSFEDAQKLEEHARKIEVECVARSQVRKIGRSAGDRSPGEFEKDYAPNAGDSRPRHQPQRRVHRSRTTAGSKDTRLDSTVMEAMGIEFVQPTQMGPARRLSLGEISTGLGNLWDD